MNDTYVIYGAHDSYMERLSLVWGVAMAEVPDYLTVEEAARVLRIGRTMAYRLTQEWIASRGERGMPCRRVGRLLRVPSCELAEFMGGPITWPPVTTAAVVALDARRGEPASRSTRSTTPKRPRSPRRAPEQTSLPFTG